MVFPDVEKRLGIRFKKRPLIVGGQAMEYYGLRKSGKDFDLVIDKSDHLRLKKLLDSRGMQTIKQSGTKYKAEPKFIDLCGDQGILVYEFEIWNNIVGFDYDYLFSGSKKCGKYMMISLEKLLFMKALAMSKPKYLKDLRLVVTKIIYDKYN